MSTIFTKIIRGEIPCHEIARTDAFMAFLDINPLRQGHTLVVPIEEVDYIFDLDEQTYVGLHLFARHIAAGLKAAVDCERVGVAVVGLEVPHTHIHLIPIQTVEDMNFSQPRLSMSESELAETARLIRTHIKDQLA